VSVLLSLEFKYRFLMPLLSRLPQKTAYRLVSLYARLQAMLHRQEKQTIMEQMRCVFDQADTIQLETWADYFFGLVEREILDSFFFRSLHTQAQIDRFIRLHDFSVVQTARAQGRRVIISSGHFGRFWMAGVGMKAQGVSVGTITRDGGTVNRHGLPDAEYRFRLKKLAWLQDRFGGPFLVEGDSVRPIYRALDEFVMAVFIDVPYSRKKSGCIELPFLGQNTYFPMGVARIAKRTHALIVPFYVFESRDGLDARFYPALDAERMDEREIMWQLVGLLESHILRHPEQWWLWQALPLMRVSV